MNNRRDFIKTGSLAFAMGANGAWAISFDPIDAEGGEFNHCIPFRKTPRDIREVADGFLWADAADFQNYGGWALDTQHVGFMGSSYLIAPGTSRTVTDATLKLKNVTPGQYRLWVRSRNWIPEHAPGTFGVAVNDRDSGKTFGAQKEKGWTWQECGVHELAGGVKLALQDKTGLFGRCSSIILTRDLKYTPPADVDAFRKERARLSGVSDAVKPAGDYDVVIVGAGVSGCCAALAAARQGARVALITDRPVLGGNASVEIGVPVQGAANHHQTGRETGLIEEAGRLGKVNGWGVTMTRPFETLAKEEHRLTLFNDAWLEDVQMAGHHIRKAILRDTLTGERRSVAGGMFIDCSGDAWLGYRAGADSRRGREARHEFDESVAPEKADEITMSGCLRGPQPGYKNCMFYRTVKEATAQPFSPPVWIYKLPGGDWFTNYKGDSEHYGRKDSRHNLGEARGGTWWNEHPGDVDDLNDPEYARDQLIRVNYTMWDFWKNKWDGRDQLASYRLDYIPYVNGKRETRRLLGDYILTQNDCEAGRYFPDAIGHYGWPLDIHAPMGIMDPNGRYYSDIRVPQGHIPYRCLYSRNIDNLLMAGRNVSVTHVALGTVRVEGQCSLMGQAAGTAAALAYQHKTTPRGIYEKHLEELQQTLLKNDQTIPAVPNQDPADLARGAVVTASSTNSATVDTKSERWLQLSVNRGEFFKWDAGTKLESIQLYIKSASGGAVRLHVREAKDNGDLSSGTDVATVTHSIPAGTEGWVAIPVDATLKASYAWIFLDCNDAIHWRSGDVSRVGSFRIYGGANDWTKVDGTSMGVKFRPDDAGKTPWSAENVINGFAAPSKTETNMWESSPKEPLPQWIELKLDRPSKVGAVQCVFDTDLRMSLPSQGEARPAVCVRDYTLECRVNGEWIRVVRERDNFQRFRRHSFKQVMADKVRLTVEATNGAATARVVELRVYPDATPLLLEQRS